MNKAPTCLNKGGSNLGRNCNHGNWHAISVGSPCTQFGKGGVWVYPLWYVTSRQSSSMCMSLRSTLHGWWLVTIHGDWKCVILTQSCQFNPMVELTFSLISIVIIMFYWSLIKSLYTCRVNVPFYTIWAFRLLAYGSYCIYLIWP